MTEKQEWEVISSDGTVKRLAVPGGWLYTVFDWIPPVFNSTGMEQNDRWQSSGVCFVEEPRVPPHS